MGGIFKSTPEMGPGAMMYISNFIKICSGVLKVIKGYIDAQIKKRLQESTLGKYVNKYKAYNPFTELLVKCLSG
jgi:hypothetical protein